MRKWLLLVFIAGLFLSCRHHDFDNLHYTITNDSGSVTVYFSFNDEALYLLPGASMERVINSDQGIQRPHLTALTPAGHPRSVRTETSGASTRGFTYTFVDVTPLTLTIVNTLPVTVTLSAGGYLGIEPTNITPGTIEAPSQSGTIFTSNPNFIITADSPFPGLFIAWEIIADTMYATVLVR